MKDKGILFDKDGTFLSFDQTWTEATKSFSEIIKQRDPENGQEICKALGIEENGEIRANSLLYSGTYFQIAEKLQTFPGFSEEKVYDLAKEIDQFFYDYLCEHIDEMTLIGDVSGLFEKLSKDGFVIGCATADTLRTTQKLLEHFNLTKYVDFIASGDHYPAKPDPDLLFSFCQEFALSPERVLVVGDSEVDLLLGKYAHAGILVGAEKNDTFSNQFKSIHDVPFDYYFEDE